MYEPNPHYRTVGGVVAAGWEGPVADLVRERADLPLVLAVDGVALLDWTDLIDGVCAALRARNTSVTVVDLRTRYVPWPEVVRATGSGTLADDPDFERLAPGDLAQLFAEIPTLAQPAAGVQVVYGPGAALVEHDRLWYVDQPKRYAAAEVSAGRGRHLGQRLDHDVDPTTRRLFYVDWPLLDRHRETISADVHRWVDAQHSARPVSVDAATLRQTVQALARQPFRTRPTFGSASWGGHWGQRALGFNPTARNTALGYELIAPESGVLIGTGNCLFELPFQHIVAAQPSEVLGDRVHRAFGTSFPIRFDYLDTVGGGDLSVHCHPQPDYMRDVFGWPYTQHETYYMMVGGQDRSVYLGLRGDADAEAFHGEAHRAREYGEPFDISRYVQTFPATPHQLFCVPVGTPHGSGAGNVVLEVSATPYLYSLRLYDWLRRDGDGAYRPVHVEHAFNNLDTVRTGEAVGRELVQAPRTLRAGQGWREELIGSLPEMFFDVRRLDLASDDAEVADDATREFHVLNVVEGDGVDIETAAGTCHRLAYAETIVVPAAVGDYTVRRAPGQRTRVVKALVR